ncbi:MAG: alpha/beta hydrolase [Candidatus Acidiferrales bacterium]
MSLAGQNRKALRVTREARGRVSGDGIELAFGYWPGPGEPIVALHGLTASYLNFIGIAELLAGRRSLFALDLRGRGDSDKPEEGPYGMAQHARDVATAMRAMGLGPTVIVGHSMGAFVATALAAQNPELVCGLILIDGGFLPAIGQGVTPQQGLDPLLAERVVQLQETYPSREFYRDFWRKKPHFPPEDWSSWVEAFLDYEIDGEPPNLRPKASQAAVLCDLAEGFKREEIVARLRAFRVPVLMIRSDSGFAPGMPPLFPDAMMDQFRSYVPGMEEETISGTTHYTMVLGNRGATRIADLVDNFARRCQPAGAASHP